MPMILGVIKLILKPNQSIKGCLFYGVRVHASVHVVALIAFGILKKLRNEIIPPTCYRNIPL